MCLFPKDVYKRQGFVILNPIRKALVNRTGVSSVAMSVSLSVGLYISHVFIPPTPGPIAAASTLGIGNNLLLVMGLGVLCSIFPLIAGYFYARYIGKKIKADDEANSNDVKKTYEELVAEYGKLPNGFMALAQMCIRDRCTFKKNCFFVILQDVFFGRKMRNGNLIRV